MMYLLLAFVFAAGFLLVFGINLLFADISSAHRQQIRERLAEEGRLQQLERARAAMQHRDLYELAAEEASIATGGHKPFRERFGIMLEQAGMRTRPIHLVIIGGILALATGFLVGFLASSIVAGILVAPLAGCLPLLWISMMRAKRLKKLQSQLPDAFDLMSRTMRAGQTMSQALQAVADEAGAPLSEEFGYCYDQQNLGMSPEAAMRDLSRRTGLLEIKIFVLAVMVHRQTGGNLAELLEKLSFVIRERYRIQGMITGLTAEGKLQAYVLLALPLVLMVALFVVNREYVMELFQFPLILLVMFGFMGLGAFWMNRIINFDY
jgi:tight adherence protein B